MQAAKSLTRALPRSASVPVHAHSFSTSTLRASPIPSSSKVLLDDFRRETLPPSIRNISIQGELGTDNLYKTLSSLPNDGVGYRVRAVQLQQITEPATAGKKKDGEEEDEKVKTRMEVVRVDALSVKFRGKTPSRNEEWLITRAKLSPTGTHGTARGRRLVGGSAHGREMKIPGALQLRWAVSGYPKK